MTFAIIRIFRSDNLIPVYTVRSNCTYVQHYRKRWTMQTNPLVPHSHSHSKPATITVTTATTTVQQQLQSNKFILTKNIVIKNIKATNNGEKVVVVAAAAT